MQVEALAQFRVAVGGRETSLLSGQHVQLLGVDFVHASLVRTKPRCPDTIWFHLLVAGVLQTAGNGRRAPGEWQEKVFTPSVTFDLPPIENKRMLWLPCWITHKKIFTRRNSDNARQFPSFNFVENLEKKSPLLVLRESLKWKVHNFFFFFFELASWVKYWPRAHLEYLKNSLRCCMPEPKKQRCLQICDDVIKLNWRVLLFSFGH